MQIRRHFLSEIIGQPNVAGYDLAQATDSPQTILEKIIWHKEKEVMHMTAQLPLPEVMQQVADATPVRDFVAAIQSAKQQSDSGVGLIAEVKKASPSKGTIRPDFDPIAIAQAYASGGAACLSVLCDRHFFQGGYNNLWQVRQQVTLPLLCKEFIISPYQVWLARAVGADALLLIAAVLCDQDLIALSQLARSLGMRSLIEVHTLAELDRILALPDLNLEMVGINNRDLENFTVDLATTQQLLSSRQHPLHARGALIVSESGIHSPETVALVAAAGASAILVGEALVKQADIEQATKKLLMPMSAVSVR
jgi:indole-3-glycerol phosphate synthase